MSEFNGFLQEIKKALSWRCARKLRRTCNTFEYKTTCCDGVLTRLAYCRLEPPLECTILKATIRFYDELNPLHELPLSEGKTTFKSL
jgi:hypothetical protein